MKKVIQFFFLLTLITFVSCKGKDGAAGAVGAVGPAGPQGIPGQMGATGAQGPAGNANVKAKIFSAPTTAWTLITSNIVGNYYESYATIPEITQAIHDKGLVLAFISEGSDPTVWQGLPYLQVFKLSASVTYTSTYRSSSKVGSVTVTKQDSDGTSPGAPALRYFKFVIIEGAHAPPPNLNTNDYQAVKDFYHIAD